MAFNIQNKVEAAWKTELEKNAYIIANSISVKTFRSNTTTKEPSIIVRAYAPKTSDENSRDNDTFEVLTEITVYTYTPTDKSLTTIREYFEAVWNVAVKTTLTDFSQSGDIVVTGIDCNLEHEEEYDDRTQIVRMNFITNVEDVDR